MSQQSNTLSTTNFANLLVGALENLGIPPHLALKNTGISVHQLDDQNSVLPFERIQLIFLNGLIYTRKQPDELALLCGLNANVNAFGSLGMAAISAKNLGNSLDLFIRYLPTYIPGLEIEKKQLNERVILTLKKNTPFDEYSLELILCSLMGSVPAMLKTMTGQHPRGRQSLFEVDLPFPEKRFILEHPELSAIKFRFSAKVGQVRFHRNILDFKLPLANPRVARKLVESEKLLETTTPRHLASLVKKRLSAAINKPPSIVEVSKQFEMSERSFSRKLKEEGHTYRHLLLETRMLKAEHELKASNKQINTIAKELGYKDVSSFNKAFKRFFQKNPSSLR